MTFFGNDTGPTFLETNQHTKMISEGPCDTEDWTFNIAITGINYISKYIKIENIILNCNNSSQN